MMRGENLKKGGKVIYLNDCFRKLTENSINRILKLLDKR